VCSNSVGS
jgi:hypothetical protein